MRRALARAHPNIAVVKYWGKRDVERNLPAVPSLSLTLSRFETRTEVVYGAEADRVEFDGVDAEFDFQSKVLHFLDRIHPGRAPCVVRTSNNFPASAGLASSSSGFAALTLAYAAAAGLEKPRSTLSSWARLGSGSACRSLWGGWVEWRCGISPDGRDSHGEPVAPAEYWDVRMLVAIVSDQKKSVASTGGMERTRRTSPYFDTWTNTAGDDVERARSAIFRRDLTALGETMERSTYKMHATMHTAWPPLIYWQPGTVACLHAVQHLRASGIEAWCTMDAGPNVKVLCRPDAVDAIAAALAPYARVEVLQPGGDPTVEVIE
jgi:diphosphomevalonate decarboxylase